jgi:hypothetical protein
VLVANTNRDDSVIEARSVEDAIAKMTIAAEPAFAPDRHPERRLKVSYKVVWLFPFQTSCEMEFECLILIANQLFLLAPAKLNFSLS